MSIRSEVGADYIAIAALKHLLAGQLLVSRHVLRCHCSMLLEVCYTYVVKWGRL